MLSKSAERPVNANITMWAVCPKFEPQRRASQTGVACVNAAVRQFGRFAVDEDMVIAREDMIARQSDQPLEVGGGIGRQAEYDHIAAMRLAGGDEFAME